MFGISFTEILLILAVALVVVGPQKLPRMLGTVGAWIGKLRRLSTEMRRQTGIDEILREEGLEGGLSELRTIMRGDLDTIGRRSPGRRPPGAADPYVEATDYDRSREYPAEGCDSYGAIPEDLVDDLVDDHVPTHDEENAGPRADESADASPKATA